jgi:tryptophan synthase alpha subunit
MAASVRGVKRDQLTFVLINPVFAYGFKTADLAASAGVSAADLKTGLGHMTAVEAAAVAGVVMVTGANAPKPARVTKRLANAPVGSRASISTFVAYDKLTTANAIDFSLSKRARSVSLRPPTANKRQFSGVVELSNGLQYLQSIDAAAATADRRATLGIQTAAEISDIEVRKVARGCRTKPGRVAVDLGDGATASLPFSTAKENDARTIGSLIDLEFIEYATGAAPAGGG